MANRQLLDVTRKIYLSWSKHASDEGQSTAAAGTINSQKQFLLSNKEQFVAKKIMWDYFWKANGVAAGTEQQDKKDTPVQHDKTKKDVCEHVRSCFRVPLTLIHSLFSPN